MDVVVERRRRNRKRKEHSAGGLPPPRLGECCGAPPLEVLWEGGQARGGVGWRTVDRGLPLPPLLLLFLFYILLLLIQEDNDGADWFFLNMG